MFKFYSADGPTIDQEEAEIERYRARHRRLCRNQQPETTPSAQVEDLDVDEGRTRKISAKWRQQQQQQQIPVNNQFDDGSELPISFNAFDFSASPEAFYETEQQTVENKAAAPSCQDNQVEQEGEHDAAGKNGRLWERRYSGLGPTKQLPTLGQDALWGGPVHYATQDAQRRAAFYQPQYYA